MNNVLVSIQCITYNHENYIRDAIEGFLKQKTNFNYEILIHDDASTDKTQDIIREYTKKYPNIIKPILQKENQASKGVKKINYTFNHNRSLGKYIALCEGDDYWIDEYKLQKQVDYMEKNPQCGLCFHAVDVINGDNKVDIIKPYNKNCISPIEDIILGDGGFIGTNSILFRKEIMDNAPDLYFNAPVGDYPLQILTGMNKYGYYINEVMSIYRTNVPGSWTVNNRTSKDREKRNIKLIENFIEMLQSIDEYSNNNYSEIIKRKTKKFEFQILLIKGDIKLIKSNRYKILYKDLNKFEKIKLYIKGYLPKTFILLRNWKEELKIRIKR